MTHQTTELILVVPTQVFHERGHFQGFNPSATHYLNAFFSSGVAHFVERPPAEQNPSLKQLIPYSIIAQGNTFLTYTRGKSGGENRLHAKKSIGIGGHVNPVDHLTTEAITHTTYLNALSREISEEIHFTGEISHTLTAGLINDDTPDPQEPTKITVGQVHLGILEVFTLDPAALIKAGETSISNPQFLTLEQLTEIKDQLEPWSQIALQYLAQEPL